MTYTLPSSSSFGSRLVCGVLAPFFLCLLLAQAVSAQTYVNNQNELYQMPDGPLLPNIPCTAFVNKANFGVTYNVLTWNQFQWVEPWQGTFVFTNTGKMTVNAPLPTNAASLDTLSPGVGYEFDTQEGSTDGGFSNVMAGTFFNPGTVHCNSVLDGNTPANSIFFFDGFEFEEAGSIGGCLIQATNIINPGNIVVGSDGELNMNGQYVDLSRSVLTLEQGLFNSNNVDASIISEGAGYNTNGDFDPFFNFTATNAFSSLPDFPQLYLSFPTVYIAQPVQTGPSNQVVRAVFIENVNTNVQASVFIAPQEFFDEGALIQWAGTFLDPATGLTDTNYLYLFHYYPGSFGFTNLFPVLSVGTPAVPGVLGFFNYLWSQPSPFPISEAPNTPGFQNIFPNIVLTNEYEFFNSSLTGTTVATNQSAVNPSGSLTNLPNQLVINASRELKLPLAQISGPNYMSITATNQFDGSGGALIYTPYSDLNLAVTNGYPQLTISNLLAASIPVWGGTLNEWSTRWTNTDFNGITTDYRVMLVYADLTPIITPQVQNLTLTASNLVISDILTVFGSIFSSAQALTLTTNAYGGGATSPDGELDLQEQAPITWSWNQSFPYLYSLTNNGAIRMPNLATFISTAPATNGVPTIPAVSATSTLYEASGKNVAQGSEVSIGGSTPYTFTNTINGASPAFFVKIGPNFDASLTNLATAINAGNGGGTAYSGGTYRNASATAGPLLTNLTSVVGITNHGFMVTANVSGLPGNSVYTFTTGTNLMWTNSASGVTLAGGANIVPGYTNLAYYATNYNAIINDGLISDQGSIIWVSNLMSGGVFDNGSNSFELTAWSTTLTNGSLTAGGDISMAVDTLMASNLMLQAGRSVTLEVTNSFTDGSVSNGSVWVIGTNASGFNGYGLVLPFLPTNLNNLPVTNNMLGTSIYMQSPPPNQQVENDWAGLDRLGNPIGYNTNNMAIGQLFLTSPSAGSGFYFSGPPGSTVSNAIYVDRLVLQGYAGLGYPNWQGLGGVPTLVFNSNTNGHLTIYYADAVSSLSVSDGSPLVDVSAILNGLNQGHLVWVPEYIGYFSGTNVTYPDGTTARLNIGVYTGGGDAQLDSNGNGTPNSGDSAPVFLGNQIDFQAIRVGDSNKLTWHSPPGATNFILYTTNFLNWNTATVLTNPATVPPPAGWPITNVVYEPLSVNMGAKGSTTNSCWYRVRINQDNAILYGQ